MPCGPFRVGQGAQTADCGFFAAYVLMQNQPPGFRPGSFAGSDVLAERDEFKLSIQLPPGPYWLTVQKLVEFLSFLGLGGYSAIQYRATPRFPQTVAGYVSRIRAMIRRPPGAILLLQRPGSAAGHYVAVLNSPGSSICCYDPMRPARSGQFNPDAFAREFRGSTSWVISH